MRIAIYPGSFDPITLGHVDLIKRGLRLFDKVIVGVGVNSNKKTMLNDKKRVELIEESLKPDSIEVVAFSRLLGHFAKEQGARYILRGMRTLSDFDYEFQMAFANQDMYPELETVFIATDSHLASVSSSLVRDIIVRTSGYRGGSNDHGPDMTLLRRYVPAPVAEYFEKYRNERGGL